MRIVFNRRTWRRVLAAAGLSLIVSTGCSNRPAAIRPPSINASQAGRLAMEEYDTDGDGFVGGDELKSAPGLNAAIESLDTDGDGKVSADEVAERVKKWQSFGVGLTSVRYSVTIDGQPLPDADVTFDPEAFLGDEILVAKGKTNRRGLGSASIPRDMRPTEDSPPGLAYGLYKVRISKIVNGQEMIPSRYNEETILGQQVSIDNTATSRGTGITFDLESK
ncbi:EF hand [Pseudobythopirellula maris]|uniref:EF hand n=1 Tax=Pseudobythopirellula maris TaxID=2527991 RepID=A0A5C5ZKB3_9BACT|nr:EF-hand domain-containing protein [Pseudobythopirellula maris]TWT87221.1 EF hand [Pseudobythopirellula maris]